MNRLLDATKTIIILSILFCVNISSVYAIEEDNAPHCDCCCCHHGSKPPKEIKDGTILTIQDCISVGLKNSPIIKLYKYHLDIAKSNVGVAKSAYFPTLNAGVGYGQQNNSNNTQYYSIYRELPNVGVSLNKMIWDFGKTSAKIKMEEFYKIGAEYQFMDSVCTTVFDIKTKYYNYLNTLSLLQAEKTNSEINKQLISEIKEQIKTNKKNRTDLINAETEQFKIEEKIIEAETIAKNAKADLNNSMYLLNAPNYKISETQTYNNEYTNKNNCYKFVSNVKKTPFTAKINKDDTILQHAHFNFDNAIQIAYENSPDLQVLISTKNAMEQALLVVKRSYYPELNADVGYNLVNTNHYTNNDLAIGVNLTSSLNAQELRYELKGASAQINLADTEIDKFKKDLYFQVQKALNNVDKTEAEIPIAQKRLENASDNLKLTINDYKSNKMNQLELQNARISYYDALTEYVNALYRYNIALIDLEISMHYHLIDLHDRTEHALKYHDEDIINNFNNIMDCNRHHHKE